MFDKCSSLTSLNLSNFDSSNVVSMKKLFNDCSSLISLNIKNFDTSKVTNMEYLFSGCSRITSLNLSNFVTDNVMNMNSMFRLCSALTSIDLSKFSTGKVTNTEYMFSESISIKEIDISNFIISKIQSMNYMFSGCKSLTSIKFPDLSSSIVITVSNMFSDSSSIISLDLSTFNTTLVKSMDYMFSGCTFLAYLDISNFNTERVTNMKYMFSECSTLTTLNLSGFNTKLVEYMNGMFYGCSSLLSLDLNHFNTSSTLNMAFMFYKLKSLENLDISNFNTSKVLFMHHMFEGCESLTSLNVSKFDTTKITSLNNMFSDCSSLKSLEIGNFNTCNVETMEYLFKGCKSLSSINLDNLNTSLVTTFAYMFSGCNSLEELNVSQLDTSNVISMSNLFSNCSSLRSLDISTLNTENVQNMENMFQGCSDLKNLNLNNINTSKVEYMNYMFSGCSSLPNLELSDLNTSLVKDMSHMLENCIQLRTINLSNFETPSIRNMDYMFAGDINLSYVNLANIQDSRMVSMLNIFQGTLENMVFCIDENSAPNLNEQIERKGCSIIDCDQDWEKNRKTIFAHSNKCVDKCTIEYQFWHDYKCHFRCPEGTLPQNYICVKKNSIINLNCTIKLFFMEGCDLGIHTNTEKQKFIEETVNEIMSLELYDLVIMAIDKHEIYTRTLDDITFQIYALSNQKREDNLVYIYLKECGEILKEKHRVFNDDLIVFKIEYKSPDFKIPIIEYTLFGRGGKVKMNLNHCKKLKMKYLIPKEISNYEEYLHDPENKYYNDTCYSPKIDSKTDLIVYDRKDYFNKNNMSLCESMCTFKGYINNVIECECGVKLKFNSFLNVNADKYKLIQRIDNEEMSKSFNIWVFKCILNIFNLDVLTTNISSFIILGIILIIFIGAIYYSVKEKYIFFGTIQKLIDEIPKQPKEEKKIIKFEIKEVKEQGYASSNNIYWHKKMNLKRNSNANYVNLKYDHSSSRAIKHNDGSSILKIGDDNKRNNDKNSNSKINEAQNETIEKTYNELNFEKYKDDIINDNRTAMEFYFSLIKTKHLLFFPFIKKNDFNSRSMKVCFVILMIGLILTISVLFIDESDLHEFYISNGAFNIFYHLPKILYSSLTSSIIKYILLWNIFTEDNFLNLKKRILSGKIDRYNKDMAKLSLKSACFFPVSIIILALCWIYIMCFGSVFNKSHFQILKMFLISFGLHLIAPFIYNFIPTFFRICSLQGKKNKEYLYRFSQYLQLL